MKLLKERWTAYDAKRISVKPPSDATVTLLERAFTSPVWYTPKSRGTAENVIDRGEIRKA